MSRQKRRPSVLRRLFYFVFFLVSGGGAGGYVLQGHPLVVSLMSALTGKPVDGSAGVIDPALVNEVVDAIKPRDPFTQPGIYQVTVSKIELDQKLFRPGHTIDIQARVRRLDPSGRDAIVWESKAYGSRLAVVGKDDLTVGWPHRPFQISWNTGDQFVLEVYDARTGLFIQPRRFNMARTDTSAKVFPLKSGDFPLELAQSSGELANPRTNHIVLNAERLGDVRASTARATQDSDGTVIIR